jgi:hypothetical protein
VVVASWPQKWPNSCASAEAVVYRRNDAAQRRLPNCQQVRSTGSLGPDALGRANARFATIRLLGMDYGSQCQPVPRGAVVFLRLPARRHGRRPALAARVGQAICGHWTAAQATGAAGLNTQDRSLSLPWAKRRAHDQRTAGMCTATGSAHRMGASGTGHAL